MIEVRENVNDHRQTIIMEDKTVTTKPATATRKGTATTTAAKAATKPTGGRKVTGKTDAELGFLDEVPVRQANGDTSTAGEVFPGEVAVEVPEVIGKGGKAGSASSKGVAKGKGLAEAAKKKRALNSAKTKANTAIAKAEKALPKLTNEALAGFKGEVEAAVTEVKRLLKASNNPEAIGVGVAALADKLALVTSKVKEANEAGRAAAKQAADQARLVKQGLTGDAEKDAEFTEIVEHSRELSVRVADAHSLNLGFLNRDGVTLTPVGLTLPEDFSLGEWAEATRTLVGIGDVSQFAIGDALRFGEDHYGNQYGIVTKALGLELSTVKNIKYVAGTFPQDERVAGASFTHHLEAAALYGQNAALARNILEQAVAERKPASWVRQQVNANKEGPTREQKRIAEVDALVLASDAQREEDLATLGTPAQVEKARRAELVGLLEYSTRNDLVKSEAVVRGLGYLQFQVTQLEKENKVLRDRVRELEALVGDRDEAAARVANVAAKANGAAVEDSDLAFLASK